MAFVKAALLPLCGSLHDVLHAGAEETRKFRREHRLSGEEFNSMGVDVMRAMAYRDLRVSEDLGPWDVVNRHHLRGQVMLRNSGIRLRMLHAKDNIIPPAGANLRRRGYYKNAPLGQIAAFDAETSNLLGLWSVDDEEVGSIRIRIVRTLSASARWYGSKTPVDLDFELPGSDQELNRLEFEQSDDDLYVELPDEVKEEGTEQGPQSGSVS